MFELRSRDRDRLDYRLELTALRYDSSGMAQEIAGEPRHLQELNRTWAKAEAERWLEFALRGTDLALELSGVLLDGPRLVQVRSCPKDWGRGNGETVMKVVCAAGAVELTPLGWRLDRDVWGSEVVIAQRSRFRPPAPGLLLRPSALAA